MIDAREAYRWEGRQALPVMGVVEHIGFANDFDALLYHLQMSDVESATFVIGGEYLGQWAILVGSGPNVFHDDVKYPLAEEKLTRAAVHIPHQSSSNLNPLPLLTDPNAWTIAKQHVGYPGDLWSDAMMANDRACNQYILERLGRKSFTYITGHSDFDSGVTCPGPTFPWAWMYHKARFIDTTQVLIAQSIDRKDLKGLRAGDQVGWRRLYDQAQENYSLPRVA